MPAIVAPAVDFGASALSGKVLLALAPLGVLAYLVFGKDRHGHDVHEPAEQVTARR